MTGASGGLGSLVLERLTENEGVWAGSRTPHQLAVNVPTRLVDFDDPASLTKGFEGAEVLLLISAGYAEDDVVIARHGAAIDAAEQAGVGHIVYTSLSAAGDHLAFALPHRWTERRLMAGRADWTILRNGIYAEMSIPGAAEAAATGRFTGPLGEGRLAAVAREDLADVTAKIVAKPGGHGGKIYELVGEHAIGGADIARAVAEATGKDVVYEPGTLAQLREALTTAGVPGWQIPIVVSTYSVIAAGFLAETGGDLADLLGRAPRSALDVIATAVG
ncbi:NAD(P)H-binding protein [Amycolatopsis deserti]|uniref:NAD(P)H-binding protein n=1 Tax=Amycolatopsis deserti TaxID=185696 RepID=UPI001E38204F|nr:NAD(P)H-binding protein [Amycolatopsis deserti]